MPSPTDIALDSDADAGLTCTRNRAMAYLENSTCAVAQYRITISKEDVRHLVGLARTCFSSSIETFTTSS
jgi:hypothetical protein